MSSPTEEDTVSETKIKQPEEVEKKAEENATGIRPPRRKDEGRKTQLPRNTSLHRKNSLLDRCSQGSTVSVALTAYGKEKQIPSKNKAKKPKHQTGFSDGDGVHLLSLAFQEQQQTIEMLRTAKNMLWQKLMKMKESKGKQLNVGDHESVSSNKTTSCVEQRANNFGDFYKNNLEEVSQVWIHLIYFIINLRINLIRIVNVAGTEAFQPKPGPETEVVSRAIECVKFFSLLKMKTVTESLEKLRFVDDPKKSETQIIEYEERMSSPFLLEMEFMVCKAKETLSQLEKENQKKQATA